VAEGKGLAPHLTINNSSAHQTTQPRSQGLSFRGGKMRDPGNEVADYPRKYTQLRFATAVHKKTRP